jgi:hypothetical protein
MIKGITIFARIYGKKTFETLIQLRLLVPIGLNDNVNFDLVERVEKKWLKEE